MRWQNIIRPNLWDMQGYVSARSLADQGDIFLDANEAPTGQYNRYPLPQPAQLIRRLAEIYQVQPEYLLVGRGADEAIDLIIRATCRPGIDRILQCPPTYGMYSVCAQIQDAGIINVPMIKTNHRFHLDWPALSKAITGHRPRLVFLCRPNNPTGECLTLEDVQRLSQLCQNCLLVVDEAYIEFVSHGVSHDLLQESATQLLAAHPNLVILRTMSKAWASAGLRVGCLIARPELIRVLHKIQAPYPLAQPVIEVALNALEPEGVDRMQVRCLTLTSALQNLTRQLLEKGLIEAAFPTSTNFALVQVKQAQELCQAMRQRGIVLRDRSQQPLLHNCIRITAGSPEEHRSLVQSWQQWRERYE